MTEALQWPNGLSIGLQIERSHRLNDSRYSFLAEDVTQMHGSLQFLYIWPSWVKLTPTHACKAKPIANAKVEACMHAYMQMHTSQYSHSLLYGS